MPTLFGQSRSVPFHFPLLIQRTLSARRTQMPDHQSCHCDAEQLWAEHGWGLGAPDLVSLLIAIFAAAALMACYG